MNVQRCAVSRSRRRTCRCIDVAGDPAASDDRACAVCRARAGLISEAMMFAGNRISHTGSHLLVPAPGEIDSPVRCAQRSDRSGPRTRRMRSSEGSPRDRKSHKRHPPMRDRQLCRCLARRGYVARTPVTGSRIAVWVCGAHAERQVSGWRSPCSWRVGHTLSIIRNARVMVFVKDTRFDRVRSNFVQFGVGLQRQM